MLNVSFKSVQGNAQNEDVALGTPLFGFVIDGASGLYLERISPFSSDAQWFARGLGKLLAKSLGDFNLSIAEHVQVACATLLAEYQGFLSKEGVDINRDKLPNATVSIVRFQTAQNQMEIFQLGDSPIMIEQGDELVILDDEALAQSDQRALRKMIEVAEERQISIQAARRFITDLLKANRQKRNTDEGYWILDPTGEGIKGARQLELPLNQVTRLAIMSDGLWEAHDILKIYQTPEALFERLFAPEGLSSMIAEMRLIQESDPQFSRYPRFKLMDDASVVRYSFLSEIK